MTRAQAVYEMDELRFCGCGVPGAVWQLILDVLDCYDDGSSGEFGNREKLGVVLPSDGLLYFVTGQLDTNGLVEHGGSLPGWISGKGKALREVLRDADSLVELSDLVLDIETGDLFDRMGGMA